MANTNNYAGFWKRLAAVLIDAVILGLAGCLIFFVTEEVILNVDRIEHPNYSNLPNFRMLGWMFGLSALDGIFVSVVPIYAWSSLSPVIWLYLHGMNDHTSPLAYIEVFASAIIGITFNWLYHAFLESSVKRATLGKQIMKLVVTDCNGQRISFAKATIRHFSKIIPTVLAISAGALVSFALITICRILETMWPDIFAPMAINGWGADYDYTPFGFYIHNCPIFIALLVFAISSLVVIWTKRKQALHDKIAGCLVCKK